MKWSLLAGLEIVQQSVSRHQQRSGALGSNWYLVAAVVCIGLFWFGLYLWDRHRKKHIAPVEDLDSLFGKLCQAHQLRRAQRFLLMEVAQNNQLNEPALLFVDPSLLHRAAKTNGAQQQELALLYAKLFGS